jgi:hypothetical protein
VAGQAAVFPNGGTTLVLPARTTSDDPQLRADQDYQTAAAALRHAWRGGGPFQRNRGQHGIPVADQRALPGGAGAHPIRDGAGHASQGLGTTPRRAERDLQAALADRDATALHPSARGLLGFIAARASGRSLHELSRRLATARPWTPRRSWTTPG